MENEDKDNVNDIEGDDPNKDEGWGNYPLDAVFVRTDSRSVQDVCRRINAGRYIMDPDFQRAFLWDKTKQSRLIESCLMRIPLPVFYVAENREGKIIVVDGLQRLTTLSRYLENEFSLSGLGENSFTEDEHSLSGKKFDDLPIKLQERLEDTQLTLYVLDSKAPERAKLDIFDRVNSGVPLTRQQMRNCLYTGSATEWLKEGAKSDEFLSATGRSLNRKKMRDREVINRFCAFYLFDKDKYKGDMDKFLASALDEMNNLDQSALDAMRHDFIFSMNSNFSVAGAHAFRKSFFNHGWRSVINISLFDAFSVSFLKLKGFNFDDEQALASLKEDLMRLIDDNDFREAITAGTNDRNKVITRHALALDTISKYA